MMTTSETSTSMGDGEPYSRRCASPLPRVAAFYRHRPTTSHPLPPTSSPLVEHRVVPTALAPQSTKPQKEPMSPVSSITATRPVSPAPDMFLKQSLFLPPYAPKSPARQPKHLSESPPLSAFSSISSSNDLSLTVSSSQSADSNCTMSTALCPADLPAESVARPKISRYAKAGGKASVVDLSEIFRISRTAAARHSRAEDDLFDEDDYTDCSDILRPDVDIDVALDEYLVLSRRYDSAIKMRREVRNALPKKKVIGGALWERLYSDISSQFSNVPPDRQVSHRAVSSAVQKGDQQASSEAATATNRTVVASKAVPENTNPRKIAQSAARPVMDDFRTIHNAQAVTGLLKDDFLKFHGLKRAMRRQKRTRTFFASCKRFLKSLLPKKPQPFPDEDDQGPPWDDGNWDRARIACNSKG